MVQFSTIGLLALLQTLAAVPVLAGNIGTRDSDGLSTNSGFVPNLGPTLSTLQKSKLSILWTFHPRNSTPEEYMSTPILTPTTNLLLGSSTNTLYLLSPSGKLLASRQLRPASFPCGDMRIGVGILGTPAIDARANTGYVFAKDMDGYHLHAFDLKTLKERKGWPVRIDGPASNDPTQHLNSTMLLQRPALTLLNGVIHAAFGGGCGDHSVIVSGWVVSVSTSGRVLTRWSTLGSSIWHAGASMSSDNPSRLFLATANGDGASPWEGAVVRLDVEGRGREKGGVRGGGDLFRPWDYAAMDESQRDIGASTAALTGFVMRGRRTVVAGGKDGTVYVLDREDLGGDGSEVGRNRVLQEWRMPEVREGVRARLFYGVGSWPRRGAGWLYVRPLDVGTVLVYEFDAKKGFKQVVQTEEDSITALGSGGPFVTADNDRDGVLWVVDLRKGLMAWDATPRKGKLTPLTVPKVEGGEGWTYKFQRPVFAEGRVYVVAREGGVVAYGAGRK